MNIYHITYSPEPKTVCLHFWGCNLSCRACLCLKEIYDCHLEETKEAIFQPSKLTKPVPKTFLPLNKVQEVLHSLEVQQVIFMGQEPTIDPVLPELAKELHREFGSYNILLTNGFKVLPAEDFDEVVWVCGRGANHGSNYNYRSRIEDHWLSSIAIGEDAEGDHK